MVRPDVQRTLQHARDPWDLLDAAKAISRGDDPAEHALLADAVCDTRFLHALDSEEEYEGASNHLRLASVMHAAAENSLASAHAVLASASRSAAYLDHPSRVDVLIDAWAAVRPSPPEAIAFWDAHAQPDDGVVERTLLQLGLNGSDPALALMERKLTDGSFDVDDREYWIYRHAVIHRDNPTMLRACKRMLGIDAPPTLDAGLRDHVVTILFDYQPKAWYNPHDVPDVRSRAGAERDALVLLREIGTHARSSEQLPPDLDARVAAELEVIGKRLGDDGASR